MIIDIKDEDREGLGEVFDTIQEGSVYSLTQEDYDKIRKLREVLLV